MRIIKQWIRLALNLVKLPIGYIIYKLTNKTPDFAYQSMIGLFCQSGGHSNDILSRMIGFFNRPYNFSETQGVMGNMIRKEKETAVTSLHSRGYYVFENRLPAELCDKLLHFATTHPCKVRPMDGSVLGKPIITPYNRVSPLAVRYDFSTQDLLNNSDIQNILADISFAAVAQDYLDSKPVLDVLSMWWHTAFSDKPDSEAAQFYHFDMDRPKWLKFFIYLTDVDLTNGPHTYIAGSHRTGGIPHSMLKKGYARLSDEEVEQYYDKQDKIVFVAPRGTIIAEDTRGLHKGKHVEKSDRLMLQLQFSNSLFGASYPKANMGAVVNDNLKNCIKKYSKLFAAYT